MNPSHANVRMRQLAPIALVLLSSAAATAAYLQALNYPFISDDLIYLTGNAKLAGLRLSELWRLFTEPYNIYEFLPLRDLSYWLDIALFGLTPSAFRVHNILLYLLCLPLVYGTTSGLWRYFRPADIASAPWAAAAVTALFALHPAHVEAVVWISGRKDVLSTMFSLLALRFAVSARREHGLSIPYAVPAMVALLAAILSKATAVAVAPVIAMLWVIFWRDTPVTNRRYSMLLWPFISLLLAVCAALVFAATSTVRATAYFGVEVITRALAVLGWLARLAVSPENRHFFYPVFEDPYLFVMVAAGVTILAVSVVGMAMMLRQRSLERFVLAIFLLLCIPYMQIIPYRAVSLVSDRFLALAVWPAMLLLVALSWRFKAVPRTVLLLVIALSWSFQTIERPRDWRSFKAMIDTDFHAYPGHYMPAVFKIIGVQLPQGLTREASETASSITAPEIRNIVIQLIKADRAVRVDAVTTGNPKEAMALLWQLGLALKQMPVQASWNMPIRGTLGNIRFSLADEWELLAKYFADDVSVRYNAGLYLLSIGKNNDAVVHLRAATESQRLPESVRGTAFKNLGLALLNNGQIAEAEAPLRAALGQPQPDMRAYCQLSKLYKLTRRVEEAARAEADCRNRAPNEEAVQ